jgi:hypothetical protein
LCFLQQIQSETAIFLVFGMGAGSSTKRRADKDQFEGLGVWGLGSRVWGLRFGAQYRRLSVV